MLTLNMLNAGGNLHDLGHMTQTEHEQVETSVGQNGNHKSFSLLRIQCPSTLICKILIKIILRDIHLRNAFKLYMFSYSN